MFKSKPLLVVKEIEKQMQITLQFDIQIRPDNESHHECLSTEEAFTFQH